MNKTVKYALFLIVLGVICGSLLALINSFTAPIIDERIKEEQTRDLREAFEFSEYSLSQKAKLKGLDKTIDDVFYAFNSDGSLAVVIYRTKVKGFGGDVTTFVAINKDGTINDAVVGASGVPGETTGYGSKAVGYDFGVKNEPIDSYSFEIISGATVTSNAVRAGIVAAVKHFKTIQSTLGGITNE